MLAFRLDFKNGTTKTVTAVGMTEALELARLHEIAMRDGGHKDVEIKGVSVIGEALDRAALLAYAEKVLEGEI